MSDEVITDSEAEASRKCHQWHTGPVDAESSASGKVCVEGVVSVGLSHWHTHRAEAAAEVVAGEGFATMFAYRTRSFRIARGPAKSERASEQARHPAREKVSPPARPPARPPADTQRAT